MKESWRLYRITVTEPDHWEAKMVELRTVRADDSDMIRRWRNLPEVSRYMYTDHDITEEEHRLWFGQAMTDESRRYWIVEENNQPLGLASIYNIDREHSRAEWALYLANPIARVRGIGAYAEHEVMRYVFDVLRLNRLTCAVLEVNERVASMHEKFGFTREGVMRQHIRKGDDYVDVILLGILRSEWEQVREGLEERLFGRNT